MHKINEEAGSNGSWKESSHIRMELTSSVGGKVLFPFHLVQFNPRFLLIFRNYHIPFDRGPLVLQCSYCNERDTDSITFVQYQNTCSMNLYSLLIQPSDTKPKIKSFSMHSRLANEIPIRLISCL